MNKTKKMSFDGVKKKLVGAVCMLLVASIMMISATYAWFTLSTAPEITGITTSVGANGNLEMALASGDVNAAAVIEGGVGSSMAATSDTYANLRWGNLVDLSDDQYGLQSISLKPAEFNNSYSWLVGDYLKTPIYGADGRVRELANNTQSSGRFNTESNSWENEEDVSLGVRAIGTNDNLSAQQSGLMTAKAQYNSKISAAQSSIRQALSANAQGLANAVTQLAMASAEVTLTAENEAAIANMIGATESSLKLIDEAYKQVFLAVASTLDTDVAYKAAVALINGATSAQDALTKLKAQSAGLTIPAQIEDAVTALEDQKAIVAGAKNNTDYKAKLTALIDTEDVTVNGFNAKASTGDDHSKDLMVDGQINSNFMSVVINDGGAKVEMPDGSGVFAYIASVVGNYSATSKIDVNFKGLTLTGMNATMLTKATVDPTLGNAMKAIQAAGASADATTTLSETYGYALDLAFRTNAVNSYLQLQTEGKQRVYSDSESDATQGAGSSMTFKSSTNSQGNALLKDEEVKSLMSAIRVTFICTGDDLNNKTARLDVDNAKATADGIKAELYLYDNAGYKLVKTGTKDYDESVTLAKLNQNESTLLTAVVWLDGDAVDNGDVANAAESITGSMNLQFSSSVELKPMDNTALSNLKVDYKDPVSANGYYVDGEKVFKVLDGNEIYKADDNRTYFSNDKSNYTRLTSRNADKALALVAGEIVGGTSSVDSSSTTALTASLANATIKKVAWSVTGNGTLSATEGTNVTFTAEALTAGADAGTATVTATITFEVNTGTADAPNVVEKTVTAQWMVTVNAPTT